MLMILKLITFFCYGSRIRWCQEVTE